MLAVGLTGGIGSGKSAVADLLVERGAVLIDADVIAREVVAPGGAAYEPLVARFGREVLGADGTVDRTALAAVAFASPEALADLNRITHPAIGATMAARRAQVAGGEGVAVLAIPLLKAHHRATLSLDAVVVVDSPLEVALDRLVRLRGMDPTDAAARVAAQMGRQERVAMADYVVENSGDWAALVAEVGRLWEWLQHRLSAGRRPEAPEAR